MQCQQTITVVVLDGHNLAIYKLTSANIQIAKLAI